MATMGVIEVHLYDVRYVWGAYGAIDGYCSFEVLEVYGVVHIRFGKCMETLRGHSGWFI